MNYIIILLLYFVLASVSTFGFALFMHVPRKHIIYASITGGFGLTFYVFLTDLHLSSVLSSFFAACVVGIFSETFARVLKAPSIVYIIPGMLPLAPGRGLYYTMENLIEKNYFEAISNGTTTIAIAGAISLGIILVTSFARTLSFRNHRLHILMQDTKQNTLDEVK